VAVPAGSVRAFAELCAGSGVGCSPLGVTARRGDDAALRVDLGPGRSVTLRLAELRRAWTETLPSAFDG
jgi:hypothetical protein